MFWSFKMHRLLQLHLVNVMILRVRLDVMCKGRKRECDEKQ